MENNLTKSELDQYVLEVMRKTFETLAQNIACDIKRYELSLENFMILEFLYSKGPHSIRSISEAFTIPMGSITYVVDKLEKKDLVVRQPNPNDRRGSNVALTDKGHMRFHKIFPQHVETISKNLSFITEDEKHQLVTLLSKVGLGAKSLQETKRVDI